MSDNTTEPKSTGEKLLAAVKALSAKVAEIERTTKLEALDREALIKDQAQRIEQLENSVFILSSMHLDLVAPKRSHPDPEVASEAEEHTQLTLQIQAKLKPETYEYCYGVSAADGSVLPGRVAGVRLES